MAAIYAIAAHILAVYSLPDGKRLQSFDVHFSGPAADCHGSWPRARARRSTAGPGLGRPPGPSSRSRCPRGPTSGWTSPASWPDRHWARWSGTPTSARAALPERVL